MAPAFTTAVSSASPVMVEPSQQRLVAGLPPLEMAMEPLRLLDCVKLSTSNGLYTPTLTHPRSVRTWNVSEPHFGDVGGSGRTRADVPRKCIPFTYLQVATFGFVKVASLKVRMR